MIAANEMASSQAIITAAVRKKLVSQSRGEWKKFWAVAMKKFPKVFEMDTAKGGKETTKKGGAAATAQTTGVKGAGAKSTPKASG
jgi:hypothetical protein